MIKNIPYLLLDGFRVNFLIMRKMHNVISVCVLMLNNDSLQYVSI